METEERERKAKRQERIDSVLQVTCLDRIIPQTCSFGKGVNVSVSVFLVRGLVYVCTYIYGPSSACAKLCKNASALSYPRPRGDEEIGPHARSHASHYSQAVFSAKCQFGVDSNKNELPQCVSCRLNSS